MCQQHIKLPDFDPTHSEFHHVQKYVGSLAVRFMIEMSRALQFEIVP